MEWDTDNAEQVDEMIGRWRTKNDGGGKQDYATGGGQATTGGGNATRFELSSSQLVFRWDETGSAQARYGVSVVITSKTLWMLRGAN